MFRVVESLALDHGGSPAVPSSFGAAKSKLVVTRHRGIPQEMPGSEGGCAAIIS
jgi:hypothetical protein